MNLHDCCLHRTDETTLCWNFYDSSLFVGGDSPYVEPLGNPVMFTNETNPDNLTFPPGVEVDTTMYLVDEAKQVDTVIVNNLNVRGNLPSVGTLTEDQFTGMNMANEILILGSGPFSGIYYEDIEVFYFNLGDGVDVITVENTSECIHVMNLAGENDTVVAKSIAGPLIMNGGEGKDAVLVSSDDQKVELIDALLIFDGGGDDSDEDTLTVDNSRDSDLDDELYLTRLLVQVDSMDAPDLIDNVTESSVTNGTNSTNSTGGALNPILPRDSFIITLRNAIGGSFSLTIYDPETDKAETTFDIQYPTNSTVIEQALDNLIIGRDDNNERSRICGSNSTSECASSCKVFQMGTSNESQT